MGAWEVAIGDYHPVFGTTMRHHIGSGRKTQVGPTLVTQVRQQIRKDDTPRPLRDGVIARKPDLLSTIIVTVPITILCQGDATAAGVERDDMLAAWEPRTWPAWLYLTDPTGVAYAYRGKPRDVTIDEKHIRSGLIYGALQFEATQPVQYGQTIQHAYAAGGTAGAASGVLVDNAGNTLVDDSGNRLSVDNLAPRLGFPAGFPLGFGTSAGSGLVVCTNGGTAETWPLLVLRPTDTQPVGPWIVRDNARNLAFIYDAKIPVGQVVVVDMSEGVVLQQSGGFSAFDAPLEPTPIALDPVTNQPYTNGVLASVSVRRPDSDWLSLLPGTTTFNCAIRHGSGEVHAYWRAASYR